ncbi:MAG: cobalt-precorrin-4/precorrin-4 C(11)-methyltransferase, partial [Thermaerobacter sp.]|nr:cobalt-precorrin-4/precorrin-4 C(11)-methyltransferase [Thermaerobacter sp.]
MAGVIHIVGAGPGDPELLTRKGARLLAAADLVLYAGSLINPEILREARPGSRRLDTAAMTLEEMVAACREAHGRGQEVVRLSSGDPCLYGATAELTTELDRHGVPWEIVPGVSSFQAAAAALGVEYTLPGVS